MQALGGSMLGRLVFRDADEEARATAVGLKDLGRVYTTDDLASPRANLVLAGVTGDVLKGVQGRRVEVLTLAAATELGSTGPANARRHSLTL